MSILNQRDSTFQHFQGQAGQSRSAEGPPGDGLGRLQGEPGPEVCWVDAPWQVPASTHRTTVVLWPFCCPQHPLLPPSVGGGLAADSRPALRKLPLEPVDWTWGHGAGESTQ